MQPQTSTRSATREDRRAKGIAALSVIVTIAVNAYANIFKLGGFSTGEISEKYPNLFTPAGLTFSIWGVIYTLLIDYTIYQFFSVRSRAKSLIDEALFQKITPFVLVSSLINIGWILAWHFRIIWLSLVLIVSLFISLLFIAQRLKSIFPRNHHTKLDYICVQLPFMVYFGWITVAVIANTMAWISSLDPQSTITRSPLWLAIALLIGVAAGSSVMWRLTDPAYGAVLVWAYAGIMIKHLSNNGHDGAYPSSIVLLSILIAVLSGFTVYIAFRNQRMHSRGRNI